MDNRSPPPHTLEGQGRFISPYAINVLSAAPVNASVVRKKHFTLPQERPIVDAEIRNLMRERMARCLRVFERRRLLLPMVCALDPLYAFAFVLGL